MLDRIVEAAVRNRLLVLLALIALISAAALLLPRLNLDAFPDVTNVQVTVNTEALGLAAEEVEQLITFPVEAVMYALPDVAEVRSISKTGLSIITVVFAEGTDIYFARQLVFERLQDAKEQIPAGVGTPEMGPNTSGLGQVFQYILRADDPGRFDAMALRGLNDWVVKLLLMPVEGVTEGVSIEAFYDQADLVEKAVATVTGALAQAFVLILVVLALFLLNIRATLLVLISIPLSVGIALMIMAWWGISANLMSSGGLAIAIGMMVDGSVVMMENIFKHLSRDDGEGGIALRIEEAAREVGRPVFFAVGVVIVVFAPLFTLQGVEGKLFQPMAVAIVLAMLASVLVALTLVPALASYVFRHPVKARTSPFLFAFQWSYRWLLRGALRFRWLVLLTALALLAGALWLAPKLGTEFVPELEEGTMNIRVTLAPSSSLDTALAVAAKLELVLMAFPEVTYASSRVGRAELGGDPEPVSNIEIYVGLLPQAEWTTAGTRAELQERMERAMSAHPGLLSSFSQPIATRVDGCASFRLDPLITDAVDVEPMDSSRARVTTVQVRDHDGRLKVSGRLEKRHRGRSPIPGHLHIEALGEDGATLRQVTTGYRRLSPKTGTSEFSQVLDIRPEHVRTVRVIHHHRDDDEDASNASSVPGASRGPYWPIQPV